MDALTGPAAARGSAARVRRPGSTQIGLRVIKYLVAPLDRWLYRLTGGRRVDDEVSATRRMRAYVG